MVRQEAELNTLAPEQIDQMSERIHAAVVNFREPPAPIPGQIVNLVRLEVPEFRVSTIMKWLDAEQAAWMRDWVDIAISCRLDGVRSFTDEEIDRMPVSIADEKPNERQIYTLAAVFGEFRHVKRRGDDPLVVKHILSRELEIHIVDRVSAEAA